MIGDRDPQRRNTLKGKISNLACSGQHSQSLSISDINDNETEGKLFWGACPAGEVIDDLYSSIPGLDCRSCGNRWTRALFRRMLLLDPTRHRSHPMDKVPRWDSQLCGTLKASGVQLGIAQDYNVLEAIADHSPQRYLRASAGICGGNGILSLMSLFEYPSIEDFGG